MHNLPTTLCQIILLFAFACTPAPQQKLSLVYPDDLPQAQFAVEAIQTAASDQGISLHLHDDAHSNADAAGIFMLLSGDEKSIKSHGFKVPGNLHPEGFSLQVNGDKIGVVGMDAAGLMYGGLELAEQIKLYGLKGIQPATQNPYMERRGVKFNIPLDARSPSYTDPCDAAQKNIAEMWNFDFWKEFIDNLARYRYDFVSLWNLHPFPSMVKVPGYEDVALADVQRSTVQWKEYYSGNGTGFDAPEILNNVEVLKKMSIEEKIDFWRKVMAYGKSRNVDFYVVTWNIFTNGISGKYGITDDIDNTTTRDYFRKSVKQMFVTYPDLAGIGLTTGENMPGSGFDKKEGWAFDTYAQGLLDASAEMPHRKFTFIHRQHMTGAQEIAKKFKPLIDNPNIEFIYSFKYAKAHVYSATKQPYHQKFVKDIAGMKTIWTLRNDDIYYFRWGAPDFVRTFIKNIPHEVSRGYYYGSDQWIWGREFLMKPPDKKRQIEIVKHWYHWMMWGRLGYNPDMNDDRFIAILHSKFPEVDAKALFAAWQNASMIYPVTTGFHWGPLDFQWYIEACKSRPGYAQNKTGFHDVNRFINLPPHAMSGYQSIPNFVKMKQAGGTTTLKTPLEVANLLHSYADTTMDSVAKFGKVKDHELKVTLNDIETMAWLGKYYAYKIAGSTQLALFRNTGDKKYQEEAVRQLTDALEAWKKYTSTAMKQNINPLWTNRVGYVDWKKITEWVAHDIEIAKAG